MNSWQFDQIKSRSLWVSKVKLTGKWYAGPIINGPHFTAGEIIINCMKIRSSGRKNKEIFLFQILVAWAVGAYRLVVLQVRWAQDLNLIVQEPDISHRFMQHRCCICLHMIIFISIPHNHQTLTQILSIIN